MRRIYHLAYSLPVGLFFTVCVEITTIRAKTLDKIFREV